MNTNNTNKQNKIIYPELSYVLTGILFDAHNTCGRFAKEKQYGDFVEQKLKDAKIHYKREYSVVDGNKVDFLVDEKVILEFKAKRLIEKVDFYQIQRYLQSSGKRLGLLVNFRNRYLKPIRVVRIDTDTRKKFVSLVN